MGRLFHCVVAGGVGSALVVSGKGEVVASGGGVVCVGRRHC